ncbi:MAG: hypothetical protein J1E16_00130 [Muribaculaceae bacterium]|nr:hypothetical protein [Muribaculaceae bacterium]
MKLNGNIIKLLNEKTGKDVTTPSGSEYLRNDIESKIGERLSLNTIKRLTGILPYDSSPRITTLDIISRYLGYKDWNILIQIANGKISEFNCPQGFIDLEKISIGKQIKIGWEPNRKIIIEHKGNCNYQILDACNSKLKSGDFLTLSQIAIGFPFMVKEVVRERKSLGNYMAAPDEGITYIEIID